MPGGQINNTDRIENYPGIERIDGPGLIQNMQKQAETFGAEIRTGSEVTILAPGSDYRNLGVPGEEQFRGSGVSYCGTCDAPFFKGKHVVAVGGGNTAVEETLHVAKFAEKVTMIHRRDEFRAAEILVEELLDKANEPKSNLTIKYSTVATAINGDNKVQSATLKNVKTSQEEDYPCDGVFIFVGMVPNTGFLKGFVELTGAGFIKCECAYGGRLQNRSGHAISYSRGGRRRRRDDAKAVL
jgi:thioredoxin reductase (NADPH)